MTLPAGRPGGANPVPSPGSGDGGWESEVGSRKSPRKSGVGGRRDGVRLLGWRIWGSEFGSAESSDWDDGVTDYGLPLLHLTVKAKLGMGKSDKTRATITLTPTFPKS